MFENLDKNAKEKNNEVSSPVPAVLNLDTAELATEKKSQSVKITAEQARINKNFEERVKKLEDKGRKRGRNFSIIGIAYSIIICLAVLISGYSIINQINGLLEETDKSIASIVVVNHQETDKILLKNAWRICQQEQDCIETQKDCCPCQTGGAQSAINIQYAKAWQNSLTQKCQNSACSASNNCLVGTTKCQNKHCVFVGSGTAQVENIIATTTLPNVSTTTIENSSSTTLPEVIN